MKEIKFYNKTTLGYPMTPSQWLGEPEYKKIKRLKMTCGGGMGGSVWFEYIERDTWYTDSIYGDEMLHAYRYTGQEVVLNPRYIVMIEDYTLMTARYYTTNSNFGEGEKEVKYLVSDGHKVNLVSNYQYVD